MLKGVKVTEPTQCSTTGVYIITPVETEVYIVPEEGRDALYIDQWCIDSDVLYHRHPDEEGEDLVGNLGVLEYDVNDRVCWKCEARCPDGIWMAHMLQQI